MHYDVQDHIKIMGSTSKRKNGKEIEKKSSPFW